MGRLDQQLIDLQTKLQLPGTVGPLVPVEALLQSIHARGKQLLPVYTQIATRFAELHDNTEWQQKV